MRPHRSERWESRSNSSVGGGPPPLERDGLQQACWEAASAALNIVVGRDRQHQVLYRLQQLNDRTPHRRRCLVANCLQERVLGGPVHQRLLHRHPFRQRDLALAAIAARVLEPTSKLATARALSTATSSLGPLLGLGSVHGNELLAMLDWLFGRQP